MNSSHEGGPTERSGSTQSQPRCELEILHSVSGERRRQLLTTPRVVIGRAPRADVVLDDLSVAATHVELLRGPEGHWWLHDLGSDTGTLLHGQRLHKQLLTKGEEVSVGAYRLRLRTTSSHSLQTLQPRQEEPTRSLRMGSVFPSPPAARGSPSLEGSSSAPLGSAAPLVARPIGAAHLSSVMLLTRELMQIDDIVERRRLLCSFITDEAFGGDSSAVLGLTGPRTARVLAGPLRRSGPNIPLYLSTQMTALVWENRRPVCYQPRPKSKSDAGERDNQLSTDCPHLCGSRIAQPAPAAECACACSAQEGEIPGRAPVPSQITLLLPLCSEVDFIEALHVELLSIGWSSQWCTMVALVVEAYQQAELVWAMRTHIREASGVEHELEMARQIQQGLVPQQAHFDALTQQLDVVVGFEPCHWVGGDYADAMTMPDGRVLLAIADVCGKGMQAALVTSSVHTFVRASIDMGLALGELVSRINRYMCRYLPDHVFVTMLCVVVDVLTGELEVVSAGHRPALIGEHSGRVWSLDVGHNVGLGLMDTEFEVGTYRLGPDQTLFLYTDGLTEAIDDERDPLGRDQLARMFSGVVAIHAARGPAAMREAILAAVRGYRGTRLASDDTTFLLARRRLSESQPPRRSRSAGPSGRD